MKRNVLVSVIIAAYNEERYIYKCLSSISQQTYSPTEIIVVDDESTDKTADIVKKFNVKLFLQKHRGPSPARNFGAENARGEILLFLDSDMKYHRKYIELMVYPILRGNVIGTFNKVEFVANYNNIWSNCWAINSDMPFRRRSPKSIPDELPLFRAIKKEEFEKVGGYDNIGYGQDTTLSKKLRKKAKGVSGAIAYHYNPETLFEVFLSSRFIGRGRYFFKPSFYNILRFSPFNSIRIAFTKIKKGAPFQFLIFKLIYDAGMMAGIFLSFGKKSK